MLCVKAGRCSILKSGGEYVCTYIRVQHGAPGKEVPAAAPEVHIGLGLRGTWMECCMGTTNVYMKKYGLFFSSFLAVVVESGVILLCRQTFCKLERFVANWVLLRLINIMALGLGCFAGVFVLTLTTCTYMYIPIRLIQDTCIK